MKSARKNLILAPILISITLSFLFGCGSKVDETKPISEIKEEASAMDLDDLRKTAMAYKEAIEAKFGEIDDVKADLKKIPIKEMLGEEAKVLKADIDDLKSSLGALKDRFKVYVDEIKNKGGDVSEFQESVLDVIKDKIGGN